MPSLFAIAEYASGNFDEKKIAAQFHEKFGVSFDDFMYTDEPDLCIDPENPMSTLSKNMLYSDPFVGFFDYTAKKGQGAVFASVAKKLKRIGAENDFGYLFETLSALASVMEVKYDLGIRTREAYLQSREAVKELLPVYTETEKRLEKFYQAFRTQWDMECKHNGFENHDIRLGGLLRRLAHCRDILKEYAEGKTERIDVLEEKILPFPASGSEEGEPVCYNQWETTAMIKPKM